MTACDKLAEELGRYRILRCEDCKLHVRAAALRTAEWPAAAVAASAVVPTQVQAGRIAPRSGRVLSERYELGECIGSGAIGSVYRVRDLQQSAADDPAGPMAVKLLHPELVDHELSVATLRYEATVSRCLRHPNIVAVHEFHVDDASGIPYITMEHIAGVNLRTHLRGREVKAMPMAAVWSQIHDMASALSFAHQQSVVHGDFKPSNVMLAPSGAAKVLDFSPTRNSQLAVSFEDRTIVDEPVACGAMTPAYASYEVINGETACPRDDLYALACVCYELLTGDHPYGRKNPVDAAWKYVQPRRPAGLSSMQWSVLLAALSIERSGRPQTVHEFIEALQPRSMWWRLGRLSALQFPPVSSRRL